MRLWSNWIKVEWENIIPKINGGIKKFYIFISKKNTLIDIIVYFILFYYIFIFKVDIQNRM